MLAGVLYYECAHTFSQPKVHSCTLAQAHASDTAESSSLECRRNPLHPDRNSNRPGVWVFGRDLRRHVAGAPGARGHVLGGVGAGARRRRRGCCDRCSVTCWPRGEGVEGVGKWWWCETGRAGVGDASDAFWRDRCHFLAVTCWPAGIRCGKRGDCVKGKRRETRTHTQRAAHSAQHTAHHTLLYQHGTRTHMHTQHAAHSTAHALLSTRHSHTRMHCFGSVLRCGSGWQEGIQHGTPTNDALPLPSPPK